MALVERVESAPGERRRLRLANPATLEPLGELEIDGAACGFRERGHYLERASRLLAVRAEEFAARIAAETGKPRAELIATEILTGCDSLQFYAKRARHILADRAIPLHLLKTKKL